MSTDEATFTDVELQAQAERELLHVHSIPAASLGVSVHDAAVTLTGTVAQHADHIAAVAAVQRVRGVQAIADDLVVHINALPARTDHDIVEYLENSLRWNSQIPDTVHVTVRDGVATLDGSVDWLYQRRAAENAVQFVSGVTDVHNRLRLTSEESAEHIHTRIVQALQRYPDLDHRNIVVTADDGVVSLSGTVGSSAEWNLANSTAWAARGVTQVRNELVLR